MRVSTAEMFELNCPGMKLLCSKQFLFVTRSRLYNKESETTGTEPVVPETLRQDVSVIVTTALAVKISARQGDYLHRTRHLKDSMSSAHSEERSRWNFQRTGS